MSDQLRVSFILCPDASSLEGAEILFFNSSVYPAYTSGQTIYLRKTLTGANTTKSSEKPLRQAEYRIIDVQHNLHQDITMGMNRAEAKESLGMEVYIVKV